MCKLFSLLTQISAVWVFVPFIMLHLGDLWNAKGPVKCQATKDQRPGYLASVKADEKTR